MAVKQRKNCPARLAEEGLREVVSVIRCTHFRYNRTSFRYDFQAVNFRSGPASLFSNTQARGLGHIGNVEGGRSTLFTKGGGLLLADIAFVHPHPDPPPSRGRGLLGRTRRGASRISNAQDID